MVHLSLEKQKLIKTTIFVLFVLIVLLCRYLFDLYTKQKETDHKISNLEIEVLFSKMRIQKLEEFLGGGEIKEKSRNSEES